MMNSCSRPVLCRRGCLKSFTKQRLEQIISETETCSISIVHVKVQLAIIFSLRITTSALIILMIQNLLEFGAPYSVLTPTQPN